MNLTQFLGGLGKTNLPIYLLNCCLVSIQILHANCPRHDVLFCGEKIWYLKFTSADLIDYSLTGSENMVKLKTSCCLSFDLISRSRSHLLYNIAHVSLFFVKEALIANTKTLHFITEMKDIPHFSVSYTLCKKSCQMSFTIHLLIKIILLMINLSSYYYT